MKKQRMKYLLAALALLGAVASCRTLPEAERLPDTPAKAAPTVTTARGTLPQAHLREQLVGPVHRLRQQFADLGDEVEDLLAVHDAGRRQRHRLRVLDELARQHTTLGWVKKRGPQSGAPFTTCQSLRPWSRSGPARRRDPRRNRTGRSRSR